jgi:SAM-dependent methyltransferase
MTIQAGYTLSADLIYQPNIPVQHRCDEYDESGFKTLLDMQERHFWYRGRHRFLLAAVDRFLPNTLARNDVIDLGGGVGGWVRYLSQHRPGCLGQIALADSSLEALKLAVSVLPPKAQRYQIDLMQLHMSEQWDAAFLLDVIEHLPDDLQALRQARDALKPGGYLFVTTPAFPQFWSYNDDMAHHLRRYRRADFVRLAEESGLTLCDSRYFMFFLSPTYWLSRIKPSSAIMSSAQKNELISKQHQVPVPLVNSMLSSIFAAETPLGHHVRFPWGTSILAVLQK